MNLIVLIHFSNFLCFKYVKSPIYHFCMMNAHGKSIQSQRRTVSSEFLIIPDHLFGIVWRLRRWKKKPWCEMMSSHNRSSHGEGKCRLSSLTEETGRTHKGGGHPHGHLCPLTCANFFVIHLSFLVIVITYAWNTFKRISYLSIGIPILELYVYSVQLFTGTKTFVIGSLAKNWHPW